MGTLAKKIEAYYLANHWHIDRQPGAVNICYIEGANADGTPNADRPDEWNDRRIVFMYDEKGEPFIALNTTATCEPGTAATMSKEAQKLGGVARVQFGQFRVWKRGFHKNDPLHPALVQRAPLMVHRDKNRDQKRTGDLISLATGINHHGNKPRKGSTKPPKLVGFNSAGCPVGEWWSIHLNFIELTDRDPNYLADKEYLFYSAFINGDDFAKFKPNRLAEFIGILADAPGTFENDLEMLKP